MSDPEMWVEGDEDGCVSIVCSRPECMKPGPAPSYNPEGLWLNPHVLPHKPDPIAIAHAWAEHRATHAPTQ